MSAVKDSPGMAKLNSRTRVILAALTAAAMLFLYNRQWIDAENLALGPENQGAFEQWNGQRITAWRPADIMELVGARKQSNQISSKNIVWLGNSQLHAINQYKRDDHLAPYWLVKTAACSDCIAPLGISLPNANLQEHLVLTEYVLHRIPVSLIILNLVFDDLREDGLRQELAPLLTPDVRQALQATGIGREMLKPFSEQDEIKDLEKTGGLHGFAQAMLEDRLDRALGTIVPLWADRANLRNRLLVDLYEWRNLVFGIKPSTIRRVIPARYERNMQAFEEILAVARKSNIPLLVYVAPIRSDVQLPYDVSAYRGWVAGLERKARQDGFMLLNLEGLVPNHLWGSIRREDVDFMHFQGPGHKLLADRLLPEIKRLMSVQAVDAVTRQPESDSR
jgi:hypothetical protein